MPKNLDIGLEFEKNEQILTTNNTTPELLMLLTNQKVGELLADGKYRVIINENSIAIKLPISQKFRFFSSISYSERKMPTKKARFEIYH